VLAGAILDRLLHASHVLNIKGRSYRLRDLDDQLRARQRSSQVAAEPPDPQNVSGAVAP
jgi:hypothetical protein